MYMIDGIPRLGRPWLIGPLAVQAVERLARKYLRRPVVITIGSAGKAVDRITQRIVIVKDNEKGGMLSRELECVS